MKLRTKLVVFYTVLIALFGAAFVTFTLGMVKERMIDEETEYFTSLVKTLALNSANAIVLKDYAALREIVDNITNGEHVSYAVILDGGGRVLAHSRHGLEGKLLDDPVSSAAAASHQLLLQTAGIDMLDVSTPLVIAGKKWGVVRIGFSRAEMREKLAEARHLILAAGIMTILLGGLATVFVARRVTESIEELRKGVEIVSRGNLDHRVEMTTGDEVGELATAFNQMTEHVQTNYLAVEHAKKEWEDTFDAISDPLFIHDRDCRVIRCNRAYAKAAGMSFKTILGRPYYEVFPKTGGPAPNCLDAMRTLVETEKEIAVPEMDKIFNAKSYLIRDADGAYLYSLHILKDITERSRAEEELHELFIAALGSLAAAIEAKSPWTKGHSERVATYTIAIAREMGIDDDELETLSIAALLHDIGKIGTYDEVLNKAGRLTDEEYDLVKQHPGKGAEMLAPIKQLRAIIPWIRGHHERYDGSGYPDGLKGEDIPLQARILGVADTFDAMTAERPYRKTPGKENAVEELKRFSGIQFDPEVVRAFLRIEDCLLSPGSTPSPELALLRKNRPG